MKYGLQEKDILKIQEIFLRHPEIESAILYGSRAKGTNRPASDIDLTLIGHKLTLKVLNSERSDLDDLNLPYTFDLSLFSELDNPALVDHIERVGQKFFSRDPAG